MTEIASYLQVYTAGFALGVILSFTSWATRAIYRAAKLFFNY